MAIAMMPPLARAAGAGGPTLTCDLSVFEKIKNAKLEAEARKRGFVAPSTHKPEKIAATVDQNLDHVRAKQIPAAKAAREPASRTVLGRAWSWVPPAARAPAESLQAELTRNWSRQFIGARAERAAARARGEARAPEATAKAAPAPVATAKAEAPVAAAPMARVLPEEVRRAQAAAEAREALKSIDDFYRLEHKYTLRDAERNGGQKQWNAVADSLRTQEGNIARLKEWFLANGTVDENAREWATIRRFEADLANARRNAESSRLSNSSERASLPVIRAELAGLEDSGEELGRLVRRWKEAAPAEREELAGRIRLRNEELFEKALASGDAAVQVPTGRNLAGLRGLEKSLGELEAQHPGLRLHVEVPENVFPFDQANRSLLAGFRGHFEAQAKNPRFSGAARAEAEAALKRLSGEEFRQGLDAMKQAGPEARELSRRNAGALLDAFCGGKPQACPPAAVDGYLKHLADSHATELRRISAESGIALERLRPQLADTGLAWGGADARYADLRTSRITPEGQRWLEARQRVPGLCARSDLECISALERVSPPAGHLERYRELLGANLARDLKREASRLAASNPGAAVAAEDRARKLAEGLRAYDPFGFERSHGGRGFVSLDGRDPAAVVDRVFGATKSPFAVLRETEVNGARRLELVHSAGDTGVALRGSNGMVFFLERGRAADFRLASGPEAVLQKFEPAVFAGVHGVKGDSGLARASNSFASVEPRFTAGDFKGKKVGVYAGSFDPPHSGHLAAIRGVKEKLGLDEVLVIVNPQAGPKAATMSPFRVREQMAYAAFGKEDGVVFATNRLIEHMGHNGYVGWITHLADRNPGSKLVSISGDDLLAEKVFKPFKQQNIEYAFLARAGGDQESVIRQAAQAAGADAERVNVVPNDAPGISSTKIRASLAEGKTPDQVAPEVAAIYRRSLEERAETGGTGVARSIASSSDSADTTFRGVEDWKPAARAGYERLRAELRGTAGAGSPAPGSYMEAFLRETDATAAARLERLTADNPEFTALASRRGVDAKSLREEALGCLKPGAGSDCEEIFAALHGGYRKIDSSGGPEYLGLSEKLKDLRHAAGEPGADIRASNSFAGIPPKTLDVVTDLDGLLIHPLGPLEKPGRGMREVAAAGERYQVPEAAIRAFERLLDPAKNHGVKVELSIFSGGQEERNVSLARNLMLRTPDGKERPLYDLLKAGPDGRPMVLSRQDVSVVRANFEKNEALKGRFGEIGYLKEAREPELPGFRGSSLIKDLEGRYDLSRVVLLDDHVYFSGLQPGNLIRGQAVKGAPEITAKDWEKRIPSLLDSALKSVAEQQDVRQGLLRRQFRLVRNAQDEIAVAFDADRATAANRNTLGRGAAMVALSPEPKGLQSGQAIKVLAEHHGVWRKGEQGDQAALDLFNRRLKAAGQGEISLGELRSNLYESFLLNRIERAGNSAAERASQLADDLRVVSPELGEAAEATSLRAGIRAAQESLKKTGATGRVLETTPEQGRRAKAAFAEAFVKEAVNLGSTESREVLRARANRIADICNAGGMCAGAVRSEAVAGEGVEAIRASNSFKRPYGEYKREKISFQELLREAARHEGGFTFAKAAEEYLARSVRELRTERLLLRDAVETEKAVEVAKASEERYRKQLLAFEHARQLFLRQNNFSSQAVLAADNILRDAREALNVTSLRNERYAAETLLPERVGRRVPGPVKYPDASYADVGHRVSIGTDFARPSGSGRYTRNYKDYDFEQVVKITGDPYSATRELEKEIKASLDRLTYVEGEHFGRPTSVKVNGRFWTPSEVRDGRKLVSDIDGPRLLDLHSEIGLMKSTDQGSLRVSGVACEKSGRCFAISNDFEVDRIPVRRSNAEVERTARVTVGANMAFDPLDDALAYGAEKENAFKAVKRAIEAASDFGTRKLADGPMSRLRAFVEISGAGQLDRLVGNFDALIESYRTKGVLTMAELEAQGAYLRRTARHVAGMTANEKQSLIAHTEAAMKLIREGRPSEEVAAAVGKAMKEIQVVTNQIAARVLKEEGLDVATATKRDWEKLVNRPANGRRLGDGVTLRASNSFSDAVRPAAVARGTPVFTARQEERAPELLRKTLAFRRNVMDPLFDLRSEVLNGRLSLHRFEELAAEYRGMDPGVAGRVRNVSMSHILRDQERTLALRISHLEAERQEAIGLSDRIAAKRTADELDRLRDLHGAVAARWIGEERARAAEIARSPAAAREARLRTVLGFDEANFARFQQNFEGLTFAEVRDNPAKLAQLRLLSERELLRGADGGADARRALLSAMARRFPGEKPEKVAELADGLVAAQASGALRKGPNERGAALAAALREQGWTHQQMQACGSLCLPNHPVTPARERALRPSALSQEVLLQAELATARGPGAEQAASIIRPRVPLENAVERNPYDLRKAVLEENRARLATEEKVTRQKLEAAVRGLDGVAGDSAAPEEVQRLARAHADVKLARETVEAQLRTVNEESQVIAAVKPLSPTAARLGDQASVAAEDFVRHAEPAVFRNAGPAAEAAVERMRAGDLTASEFLREVRAGMRNAGPEERAELIRSFEEFVKGKAAYRELASEGEGSEKLAEAFRRTDNLRVATGRADPEVAHAVYKDAGIPAGRRALSDALGGAGEASAIAQREAKAENAATLAKLEKENAELARDGAKVPAGASARERKLASAESPQAKFERELAAIPDERLRASILDSAAKAEKGNEDNLANVAKLFVNASADDRETMRVVYGYMAEELAKGASRDEARKVGVRKMLAELKFDKTTEDDLFKRSIGCFPL